MTNSSKKLNRPKLIIFDLDGTLVEFSTDYLLDEAIRIIEKVEHPEVARHDLLAAFSSFDFFRFVATSDRDEFVENFWKHFDWLGFPQPAPFATTLTVLQELKKRGFELAIATARQVSAAELKPLLEAVGILPYFSAVCTRTTAEGDWKDKKPQIHEVCAKLGISPEESIIVGDIPPDIASGRDVGIGYAIALTSGGILREILAASNPDFILDDLAQLLELEFLLSVPE